MHLVVSVPSLLASAGQQAHVVNSAVCAALARFVAPFGVPEAVVPFIAKLAGASVDVVGDRAGQVGPAPLVRVALQISEGSCFWIDPADLEGNPPGEVAVLGIFADIRELVPAHHGTADASHVHPFVGMRIARVGIDRIGVVRDIFPAASIAQAVPGIAADYRDLVAERLNAELPVIDPHDVQDLRLAETAFAGCALGLPRLGAQRQARRRLGRRVSLVVVILDPAMLVPVERVVAFDIVIGVLGTGNGAGVYPASSHAIMYEAPSELFAVVVLLRHVREASVVLRIVVRQVLVGIDSSLLSENRQGAQEQAGHRTSALNSLLRFSRSAGA